MTGDLIQLFKKTLYFNNLWWFIFLEINKIHKDVISLNWAMSFLVKKTNYWKGHGPVQTDLGVLLYLLFQEVLIMENQFQILSIVFVLLDKAIFTFLEVLSQWDIYDISLALQFDFMAKLD